MRTVILVAGMSIAYSVRPNFFVHEVAFYACVLTFAIAMDLVEFFYKNK